MAAAGAAGNGVRGKLQQTASSVKSALTIQPRVVPAADETSLTFNPGPLEPDLFVAAAAVMEQQNRNAEAVKKYNEALALDANHREALVGLARLKHREGDLAGALETYQRALQAHPQDAVLLNDVGLCYARAGQSDNALAMLQQAVQLNPDSTLYRNNMAAVLVEANRSADAVALLAPTYGTAVAYYNVGYLLQQRGESQAAVGHFAAALDANPSLEPARLMLHRLAPQMAQRPDAVTVPAASRLPATSAPGASAPGRSPAMQDAEPSAAVPARPAVYAETAAAYQSLPPFAAAAAPAVVAHVSHEVQPAAALAAPVVPEAEPEANAAAAAAAAAEAEAEAEADTIVPVVIRLPDSAARVRKPGRLVPPAPQSVTAPVSAHLRPAAQHARHE